MSLGLEEAAGHPIGRGIVGRRRTRALEAQGERVVQRGGVQLGGGGRGQGIDRGPEPKPRPKTDQKGTNYTHEHKFQ